MAKRLRFDLRKAKRTSRNSLSTRTKSNLNKLESMGFKFPNVAHEIPVGETKVYLYGKLKKGLKHPPTLDAQGMGHFPTKRKTIVLKGKFGSQPVTYIRRETANKAAGQTYLQLPSGVKRVSHVLGEVKERK